MSYNVVFEYTKEAGGYAGVRTWTSFESKEAFQEWYTPNLQKRELVFREGVTSDEAIELTQQTPIECYITSCLEEATDPRTGEIDGEVLEMKLRAIQLAGLI